MVESMTGQLPYESQWPHRQFWIDPDLELDYKYRSDKPRWACSGDNANLVSSRTKDGLHAPALDIDFPARLVPSKTSGHYHLYLDKAMPWWRYRIMLKVLAWCGIIEKGYYRASVVRKQTFLRRQP